MRARRFYFLLAAINCSAFAAEPDPARAEDPLPEGAVARMGSTRFHQPGPVFALAFSPDGKTLASSGFEKTVIWDFKTGRELVRLKKEEYIHRIAFSPDGKVLATSDAAGAVCLRDSTSGKSIRVVGQKGAAILAFAPNGKWLASVDTEESVRILNAATGDEQLSLSTPSHKVRCLAISPDSKLLVTGGRESKVILWDTQTGKIVHTLTDFTQAVNDVTFSPDGKMIATGGETSGGPESAVYVWNATSGKLIKRLADVKLDKNQGYTINSVKHVRFHPDGRSLITCGSGYLKVWDLETGSLTTSDGLWGDDSFALSPDGRYAVAGGHDGFHIWDLEEGRERIIQRNHGPVSSVTMSSDGKMVASALNGFGVLQVWDAVTGRHLRQILCRAQSVAFRPGLSELAVTETHEGAISLFDPITGKRTLVVPADGDPFVHLAWSSDGNALASAKLSGTIAFLDPGSGKTTRTLKPSPTPDRGLGIYIRPPHNMGGLSFTQDMRLLVSSTEHSDAFVWDTVSGQQTRHFAMPRQNQMAAVCISPDGKTVVTGIGEELVLWEEASGERIRGMKHDGLVTSAAFSPDGNWIASGSFDKTVRIWNAKTGQQEHVFKGHANEVMSIACSADGTRVISGGADGWILVWDLSLVGKK